MPPRPRLAKKKTSVGKRRLSTSPNGDAMTPSASPLELTEPSSAAPETDIDSVVASEPARSDPVTDTDGEAAMGSEGVKKEGEGECSRPEKKRALVKEEGEDEGLKGMDIVKSGDIEERGAGKVGEMVGGGEPVEEVPVEGQEPVEEEPVEEEDIEEEPMEQEPVEEEPVEEEPVEEEDIEEEPMEQEPVEDEPIEEDEEEEDEDDEEEGEEEEEEEGEGEEEEEDEEEEDEEEEPVEEELRIGDGKEGVTQEQDNEDHKKDIVAVEAVQSATVDGEGGENEEQGLDDVPEPTMYMKALLPNRKVKDTQIFISQLEKSVVEEDIAKVFARFGEIQSVRVVRHSQTQKSKGFAFLQYSTAEAAEKALSQLKDGTEIKGRIVHLSPSNQENCTIFVGNICKSWSKDQVLGALKDLGIEGIEQLALPEDQKVEGKIKGFAFVEFCTHVDAKAALNRLCKPDAVLGCDFSAKVSFAQFPVNSNEGVLSKVKSVYLEPIPKSWDGQKIEDMCKEYGPLEKIRLYRKSKTSKKKDFAFVDFVSREGALSCVEGLNKALDIHDDIKISASIARPFTRKTGTKFMMRGNYKVKKEGAEINKGRDEKVEKAEVKIVEVSGGAKKKHKKPKLKDVLTQKSRALSPQKTIKKNKKVNMNIPSVKELKEGPQRHAPKKKPNKEAAVPIHPQRSKKRPFQEAPEPSRRPSKGKMKLGKGMPGGPHAHQSGIKKQRPIKGGKQHQRVGPAVHSEGAFKRARIGYHGDYHSHGSLTGRPLSAEYAYEPPPYTSSIHVPPPYARRIHEPSRYEPPLASRTREPSIIEPPYNSRSYGTGRHDPSAYASGSYYPHRNDLMPQGGYIPPTQHAPSNRHVYEMSAPVPYDGGYDRAIIYTREPPPVPPTSRPGYVTYPRYQQPSYPYPSGGSYPADFAPRSYY